LYLKPAFLQGIGDENAPAAAPDPALMLEFIFAPATLSNFERRDGGSTISRSAFGEVVNGCPPESSVSSRSYVKSKSISHADEKGDGPDIPHRNYPSV
jgi:hypothetical protein